MSGRVLLFGFEELPAVLAVAGALKGFGAEVVPVARGEYRKPLGVLAGLDDDTAPASPYRGGPLGGRMAVFCGLDGRIDALLPAMAQAGAGPGCLKAVLTPRNRMWDPLTLFAELQRERKAIEGR